MLDLTIAIPVKNEEKNIGGCLHSIGRGFARKILLIDSGSTDRTKDIAYENDVEVIDFRWNGLYPKKRNWFLQNHAPDTKWVLFLDADEYLTSAFKEELSEVIITDDKNGYWLRYSIYFLGRKLKRGYPLKKLALFKVGSGQYEQIEEDNWSKLDMEIHEHPVLNGETGVIKSCIDHRDYNSLTSYIQKHNEYAEWEARRFIKTQKSETDRSQWTWKQKLKYRLLNSVWIGPVYFIGSYILMGGFLDGSRGLAFALMKMNYFTQVYCKIQEQRIK